MYDLTCYRSGSRIWIRDSLATRGMIWAHVTTMRHVGAACHLLHVHLIEERHAVGSRSTSHSREYSRYQTKFEQAPNHILKTTPANLKSPIFQAATAALQGDALTWGKCVTGPIFSTPRTLNSPWTFISP